MGYLSTIVPFSFGSSVGQIAEPQPAATNLLTGSYLMSFTPAPWTVNGGAGIVTLGSLYGWDAGSIPANLSGSGLADYLSNTPSVVPAANTQYTIQCAFSVDSDLLLVAPSNSVRMSIAWTGGVAREDYVDFNPATGGIIGSSTGVVSVTITPFDPLITPVTPPGPVPARVFTVSLTTAVPPAATTGGQFRIYPKTTAGIGRVAVSSPQVEAGIYATAFISNSVVGLTARYARTTGMLPRLATDRSMPVQLVTAGTTYTYQDVIDNGMSFLIQGTGTFALPGLPVGIDGQFCTVMKESGAGFFTLTTTAANAVVGPGFTGAGPWRIPYDNTTPAGGTGPWNMASLICVWDSVAGRWEVRATSVAPGRVRFTANGSWVAGNNVSSIWIDGAAGGGGGGGAAATGSGGGGGGGEAQKDTILTVAPGTSYAVTIGAGGAGGAAGNNVGIVGTNTIFGALLTLTGGNPGGGAGAGLRGFGGLPGGAGGGSGGCGNANAVCPAGSGGGTIFAAPTFDRGATTDAGAVYGGGGSGGNSAVGGGAGAAGVFIVKW